MKRVLITGVTGQTGSYMVDYLLANTDCEIYGMVRRLSNPNYQNIKHNLDNPRFKLVFGDLLDSNSIDKLVKTIQPDYIFNYAANSFVGTSWDMPIQHFEFNAMGVLRFLEAIKKYKPECRFWSSGSSEEDGKVSYSPQDLNHPPHPRSPYGCAKVAARFIVQNYRESFNLFAVHCRCHNHESERRGEEFVTRKITKGVARIYHAIKNNSFFEPITLGFLDSRRDWSHAQDFVEAAWLIMNKEKPKDYILSSNETHSVREFIEIAFKEAGIEGKWTFRGTVGNFVPPENETFETLDGKRLITIDPKFYRPCEVETLWGNSDLAREELNWTPKISFNRLISRMVENDIKMNN